MPWQLEIEANDMVVRLNLEQYTAGERCSFEELTSKLEEKDIPINPAIESQIREFLNQIEELIKHDKQPILFQAQSQVDGEDGHFDWSEVCAPGKKKMEKNQQDNSESANFYNSIIFIAQKDKPIGILHPATTGEPGMDVYGRAIAAKPGAELKIEPGPNVKLLGDGQTFVAECDGEPILERGILRVEPTLTINSSVDFETGNISFSGDVAVKGDIKDLFKVLTGGNLNVGGTIEAAQIECAGSLEVSRGIFGKEKGKVKVQKDLAAKYLSNVQIWAKGDITIDSEIVNVNLNCGGNIFLQRGAIHGGRVSAAGNIEAPVIGSPAGVRTIVRSAVDPFLEGQIETLERSKTDLAARINSMMPIAKALLATSGGQPSDKLRKIADEIQTYKQQMEKIEEQLKELTREMAEICTGIIIVHKLIYPGVVLQVGDKMQIIEHEMTGPMEVVVDRSMGPAATLSFRAPAAVKED